MPKGEKERQPHAYEAIPTVVLVSLCWWGEAPERPKEMTRVLRDSLLGGDVRPKNLPSRGSVACLRIKRGTSAERLGAVCGLVSTREPNHLAPPVISVGLSGASPPYGVVKLPSVFLAEFHVL